MKRTIYFVISLAVLGSSPLSAFDLREALDKKTVNESGLDKLTEEELATLNAAVAKLLGKQEDVLRAETSMPQGDDRFGIETVKERVVELFQADSPKTIESTIAGEFSGWRGKTKFRLENGQVWQQTEPETFIVKVMNPKVTIRRGMFGSYLLKIEGYNSSVRVERIE